MTLVAGSDVLQFLYDAIQNGALEPSPQEAAGVDADAAGRHADQG
jgi:hypothetical protein